MTKQKKWNEDIEIVRRILLVDWQPIIPPVPEDEYDSYAFQLLSKLYSGTSVEDIASYLGDVEEKRIGVGRSPDNFRYEIATKILSAVAL